MKKSVLYIIGLAMLLALSRLASAYAIVLKSVDASDAESKQELDFNEDTYMYRDILDATTTGYIHSYMLWHDWGGWWCDAEKVPGDDGAGNPPPDNPGEEDDLMCWAAAASNVLEWTRWGGLVSGMGNTDQMFEHFQDHWYDDGGLPEYAWHWWFDGTETVPGPGWSYVDVAGGGNFWPLYDFTDYYDEVWTEWLALPAIDDFLHDGYGVALAIYTGAGLGHAITCWGFSYDSDDPDHYVGIWVTDSDDDKHLASPPDTLRYYEVAYDSVNSRWHLQNLYGSDNWYIGGVMALHKCYSWTENDNVFDTFGPRADNLVMNLYPTVDSVMAALQAGEIDVADWVVPAEWREDWSVPPYSDPTNPDYIEMGPVKEMAVFEFDLNHKEEIWSQLGYTNPMTYQKFRQAIVHLTNKSEYVEEILNGEGVVLGTPIMPWTVWYNTACDDYYPYDLDLARAALDAAGFTVIPGAGTVPNAPPGSDEWRRHPETGAPMQPLILYIRAEYPDILAAGLDIVDKLMFVGIPVVANILPWPGCYTPVFRDVDYHLYAGYQRVWKDPDYLYDLYGGHAINRSISRWYNGTNHLWYNNTDFNEAAAGIKYATTFAEALTAAKDAQLIMTQDVCNIPLWGYVGFKAQRGYAEGDIYKPWHGFVNEEGIGKNSWWTFLSAHPGNAPTGGTVTYGLRNKPLTLNPMRANTIWPTRSSTYCDWEIMNKIYDSLLREDPYTFEEDIPWLAHSWHVGTYYNTDPAVNKTCTILNFNLEDNLYWHDGVHFTSADVKFSIEHQRDNQAPWWGRVMDVYDVIIVDPYTVMVLMKVSSMWALHWIGEIPILPKHIWETITGDDIETAMPDPYLIGTGPFKYEGGEPGTEPGTGVPPNEYVKLSAYKPASAGYFRYSPIKAVGGINIQADNRDPLTNAPVNPTLPCTKRTIYAAKDAFGNSIHPHLDYIRPLITCKNLHSAVGPVWAGNWIVSETTGIIPPGPPPYAPNAQWYVVQPHGPPVTNSFNLFSIAGYPTPPYGAVTTLPSWAFAAIHDPDAETSRSCSYTETGAMVKTFLGDIDGDGYLTALDVVELNLGFILWLRGGTYHANADINGDAKVSVLDALELQWALNNIP